MIDIKNIYHDSFNLFRIEFSEKNRNASGYAIKIEKNRFNINFHLCYDKIEADFGLNKKTKKNYGLNIKEFLDLTKEDVLYCSNLLQPDFVLASSILICNNKLIKKPTNVSSLDSESNIPLNGEYNLFSFETGKQFKLSFNNGKTMDKLYNLSFYGSTLIKNSINMAHKIKYRPNINATYPYGIDINNPREKNSLLTPGPVSGDEVNYPPFSTFTSFTSFGSDDEHLYLLSMFEKPDNFGNGNNRGISIKEIGDILLKLGATEAVVGGGSGDTQQYIKDIGFNFSCKRKRPENQGIRKEIDGIRGLSTIIYITNNTT